MVPARNTKRFMRSVPLSMRVYVWLGLEQASQPAQPSLPCFPTTSQSGIRSEANAEVLSFARSLLSSSSAVTFNAVSAPSIARRAKANPLLQPCCAQILQIDETLGRRQRRLQHTGLAHELDRRLEPLEVDLALP